MLPWKVAVHSAEKHKVNLITFCGNSIRDSYGYDEQGNTLYDLAKGGKLDGLITWKGHITVNMNDEEISDFLKQYKIPVVLIEGTLKGYTSIKYDNYDNIKKIIDHLIKVHGLRRIGYTGFVPNHEGFMERFRAYNEVLKENNITIDQRFIKPWGHWDYYVKGNLINDLLDSWLKDVFKSGLQAIVGSCDPTAVWLIKHLKTLGIRVPDDMIVAGHDGFLFGGSSNPSLTTIRPSWIELGSAAIDTIIKLINGIYVPENIFVPSKLIVG